MDIRKVKKLIELLEESNIGEIEIKEGEESVRISRYGNQPAAPVTYAAPAPVAPAPAPAPASGSRSSLDCDCDDPRLPRPLLPRLRCCMMSRCSCLLEDHACYAGRYRCEGWVRMACVLNG